MILLPRLSGRIMSQPLGENFYPPEHIIYGKIMSVQNKNFKFLSLVFWKINLSKLTLLFKFSMLY